MRKIFTIILFVLASVGVSAQDIEVVNSKNKEAIPDVAIFNLDKTKSALTNINGKALGSLFSVNDTLVFQHAGYYERVLPYTSVVLLNFVVKLDEKLIDLSEIVISANKWEQNKSEVPNKITSVEKSQIELYNPQTSADILASSGEVFIQKSQMGGGSPMIRGFSANSVLLVVDGIRMNNAIYRSGNLQNVITLDPNIMESAEVVFGPGSIIYGSDALGGVMDFHTKKVRLNAPDDKDYSVNVFSRFSTANFEKTFHVDVNYHGKKWGWLSSITFSDFGDLRQGANGLSEFDRTHYVERVDGVDVMIYNSNVNIQEKTAYNQTNFLQKFRYRPNDDFDLNYAFYYTTSSNVPRYDRLVQYSGDDLKYAEWYYGPQFWMYHALNLRLQKANRFYDASQINIAYQDVEESRYSRKFGSEELKSQIEKISVFTFNADFDKEISKKTTLFYGFEALYNKVNSDAYNENIISFTRTNIASRYPDGGSKYYSFAAYTSFKSNITNELTFSGGLRYSQVNLKSEFDDKSFYDFPYDEIKINNGDINASLGLVYRPSIGTQFNFNLSSGFRAPNLDDVAKVFDSTPGNVVMPNEDLKPEKAYNVDLGLIHKFNNEFVVDMVVFYTYLDNAMVRRDFTFNGESQIMYDGVMSQVQAIINAGHANIYGASFGTDLKITSNLTAFANLTYTKGEDNEDNALRHVPPVFGDFGLKYQKEKVLTEISFRYNGEISYENLAPSEQDKSYMYALDKDGNTYSPSWLATDLKVSYSISKNFTLYAGISNIFDKRYRPYSSGISAPGRNFYLSLKCEI